MSSTSSSLQSATVSGIGAAVRRREDFRFITGKGQYTDDISRPGETRAVFVRSPYAHARIKRVDTQTASAMPGVLAVLTGSHSHGQGHETTFARLVSERLGIPIETVSIVHGDTDKVQFGIGTYGSRSGAVGMSAIDKVEAKAKKVAAFMMEAAEGDIEFKDGRFTVAGTDKSIGWGEVALNAYVAHKLTGAQLEPGLAVWAAIRKTGVGRKAA
jgi:CO/xanthine dehydrogenase Mo-binding subunit